jgi:hypothetical protein
MDLLEDVRVGRRGLMYEGGLLMPPVSIPNGIGPEHLAGIRHRLRGILKKFKDIDKEVRQVNLRLNESGAVEKLPVFIDWVGDSEVMIVRENDRHIDPGLHRFGDRIPSKVYVETIDKSVDRTGIPERNWLDPDTLKEKRPESQLLAPKWGATYQKFIGIIADQNNQRRCVGTLTVGFSARPEGEKLKRVETEMRRLASWDHDDKSDLVRYIEETFILGGPFVSRSFEMTRE